MNEKAAETIVRTKATAFLRSIALDLRNHDHIRQAAAKLADEIRLAALEREHFGDPDKGTGVYTTNNAQDSCVHGRNFPVAPAGGLLESVMQANHKLAGALDMIRETLSGGNVDDLLYIVNKALDEHYSTLGVGVVRHETFSHQTPMPSDKTPGG